MANAPLNKLEMKLLAVKAVLNDAELKQFTHPFVKAWLDAIKHVVYIAQDLVDEIATDSLQCELKLESHVCRDEVNKISSTSFNSLDERMELKVKVILERLEYIAQQKDLLGLKEIVETKLSQRLPSTSVVEESGVYGRDEDKAKIIEFLLLDDSSGNEIGVIPIVSMGGVGKTTLAQLVYNDDDRLKNHFNSKAWVCVSEEFDVVRVTKNILEAVTSSSCDVEDLILLQIKLKEILIGKKFLLILDDVWNENHNHWDILLKPFRVGAKGSKIIVTTRSEKVAKIVSSVPTLHLNQLSNTHCWLLFAKHAFDNNNSDKRQELQVIGKKIVEKCKGLPLAAKILGGLLRSKADAADWYKILESELWELPIDKNDILPALILSYHNLPLQVKCCFAYCSILPKDCEFEKKEIVLLWMAEDLLRDPTSTSKQMEEVGHEYFDELISRSFFQRSSWDESRFIMHDLVNDLANFVSGEFTFRWEGDKLCRIPEKTRHLSICSDGLEKPEDINDTKFLRSFLSLHYSTDKVQEHLLSSSRYLRVFSLSPYSTITEVPESIGDLKLLRYLNLSGTAIQKLPDSTSALCNLQTLLLSYCELLTELPANTGKLINLRHLDVRKTNLKEMPMHMSRLINLQTLSTFIVGKNSGSPVTELRDLKHLQGKLKILNLQNVNGARVAQEAILKDTACLEKLWLEWSSEIVEKDSQNARDVLDMLRPQNKLKELTITHYGGTRFPEWLGDQSFSNMVYLRLRDCKNCFSLPPLGMLPSLRELSIIQFDIVSIVGPEFYGTGPSSVKPFRSLEILRFEEMPEWEEWCCCTEFTRLKKLYIKDCPRLKGGLPDDLPCLIKVEITNCEHLQVVSLPKFVNCPNLVVFNGNDDAILQPKSSLDCIQNWKISGLSDLKELPALLMQRLLITELNIDNCPFLESFPLSGLPTTLKKLDISRCGKLDLHLPQPDSDIEIEIEITHYSSSASLEFFSVKSSCDSLESFPLGLFPKLKHLWLSNCASLEFLWIPEEVHEDHLVSLTSLEIVSVPNLKSLNKSGRGLQHLTSLEELFIYNCPKLQSLPEHGLPNSLHALEIWECPLLKQWCQGENEEGWAKIAHIPKIVIDNKIISSAIIALPRNLKKGSKDALET